MDKLYMVILLLTIIPILICIKYARKVKSDVADSITRCLFFVTITIIGNIVFAFSQYQLVAYFMESVYLFFFDLVLIYILQYSQQYTRVFNEVSAFRIGCFIVAYLDGISLLLNTFFHHVFTLKKVSYIGIQMHCISSKTIFYDLHYVFVYCLMFCVIASFLTKIMRISSFYRTKYIPIFVVLCVIMALNIACNVSGFPLDLSLPFYVFAAILICYLTLYRAPRELIEKTLSFVVTKMNNAVVCFDINQECAYANDHFRSMLSSTNDDFSKIKYGGQEGFVMTKYLTEDANIAIQQAGNKNAKPAEPVQHATGSSDVSVKFTMYVFNVQNSIYLRKYAEENSENICTIPWGEPVGYIEDVTNGFYKIKYKGQIGYAKAEYLTSTDPHVYTGGNPIYHISGVQNSVYLRKTPSEPAEYICEIPVGAAVEYLGSYNGYDKVNYNGMVGYVTSAYVR
jgi:hypothetical protein